MRKCSVPSVSKQDLLEAKLERFVSGESITEVLVAILVAALAAVMIAVAVTTARNITNRSTAFEEASAASISQAEQALATGTGASEAGIINLGLGSTDLIRFRRGGSSTSIRATAYLTDSSQASLSTNSDNGFEDLLVFVRTTS